MPGTHGGRVRLDTVEWVKAIPAGPWDHTEECNHIPDKKESHGMVLSNIVSVSRVGIQAILWVMEEEGEPGCWKAWHI